MKKCASLKYLLSATVATLLSGVCLTANAAAFQLYEYNGVNAANFGAGAAASAEDASTAYSNPAGMVLIPNQQLVISGNEIISDIQYNGSETWRSNSSLVPAGYSSTQSGKAQGGGTKFLPSLHYVSPFADKWAFGLSVLTPFGLASNYGPTSILRYAATQTELKTIDISPSLAFKANDNLALGAGLDFERLDATFNGVVGSPPIAEAEGVRSDAFDTQSKNSADGWGIGWHAGVLYQFTPQTRAGLTYHSPVHFSLNGSSKLNGPLAQTIPDANTSGYYYNNNLRANITLPPATELSAYHEFNPRWAMAGSLIYTQWRAFNKQLNIQNVEGISVTSSGIVPEPMTVSMPNYFHNTWRAALGMNYRPADQWIVRAGAGYDQSPVRNTYRNVRLPDADRYALAIGAHYQAVKAVGVDVGWTHLFVKDARVNSSAQSGPQIASNAGKISSHADILAMQLTWDIT